MKKHQLLPILYCGSLEVFGSQVIITVKPFLLLFIMHHRHFITNTSQGIRITNTKIKYQFKLCRGRKTNIVRILL